MLLDKKNLEQLQNRKIVINSSGLAFLCLASSCHWKRFVYCQIMSTHWRAPFSSTKTVKVRSANLRTWSAWIRSDNICCCGNLNRRHLKTWLFRYRYRLSLICKDSVRPHNSVRSMLSLSYLHNYNLTSVLRLQVLFHNKLCPNFVPFKNSIINW